MSAQSTPGGDDPAPDPQARFGPVIERAPLPMMEVEGSHHTVCCVNDAFCRLVGKMREELVGKPFAEIVVNGAACVPLLNRVYETGEFETHVVPDPVEAEPVYWLYAMWPALDEQEKPVRVIIQLTKSAQFQRNAAEMNEALLIGGLRQHELREEAEKLTARLQVEIADRKRAEEALQFAQAELYDHARALEQTVTERTAQLRASVEELEAFSYSLVHDLRAPIRAIQGFTEAALEMTGTEVGPPAAELLRRVVKAAARMDSLIQDVLSLSQVIRQPIRISVLDVDALVQSLLDERPELSPTRAHITVERPLLAMSGHEALFSQCLTNLLGNAVKFVASGVRPEVRVWSEEVAPVLGAGGARPLGGTPFSAVCVTRDAAVVRLWIEDNGVGIPGESQKKIFEIFQRLHGKSQYEGSGIGLSIVRKAIERMGGRVGVESAPGKGSRFWLELPKG